MEVTTFGNYYNTIKFSLKIIKKYHVYVTLLFIMIMKMAPEINGPLEYFYGYYLQFSNSDYAVKNIFSSLGFFLGVIFVSVIIPKKLHKKTLIFLYTVFILSLIALIKLINSRGQRDQMILVVLGIHLVINFASETINQKILAILTIFCPSYIEATYVGVIEFLYNISVHISTLFSNVLIWYFDLDESNGY